MQTIDGGWSSGLRPSYRQRTAGAGGSYAFGAATLGAVWTNSALDRIGAPGATMPNSSDSLRFNNYEVNASYALTPAMKVMGVYTFSTARTSVPDHVDRVRWHQFGLQADYLLSKRTDLYLAGALSTRDERRSRAAAQHKLFR